jgi:hypothetical protein
MTSRESRIAHLIERALRRVSYIDGRQAGDTPDIERAAMQARHELINALEELEVGRGSRAHRATIEASMRRVAQSRRYGEERPRRDPVRRRSR